ncbi:hypothetical protein LSAT2_021755 [Lamellibrachia satsuma]|nr:hypothetical protein LSAT2_021755 [Lamellibrachia satsuma]
MDSALCAILIFLIIRLPSSVSQGPCRPPPVTPPLGAYTPHCTHDGAFKSTQCHSSSGYCWCVNHDGTEIAGTRKGPGKEPFDCGQDVARGPCPGWYTSSPLMGAYEPQCTENGWYKRRQCHSSTGHCWCVTVGGTEIIGTRKGPGRGPVICGKDSSTVHENVAVTVTNVTYSSLLVRWSVSPSNASDAHYELYYVKARDKKVSLPNLVSLSPNVTEYSVTALEHATRYRVYMTVYYSSGVNISSNVVSHVTSGYGGPNSDRPCDCDPFGSNSTTCDQRSGQCVCRNKYTQGHRCSTCIRTAYKHEKIGCTPCHCPTGLSLGHCSVDTNGVIQCACVKYRRGRQCEGCWHGYYNNNGTCAPCDCNKNSDGCDVNTGECLACQFNTTGAWCHQCLPGCHGDALSHNCTCDEKTPTHATPPAAISSHHHTIVVITVSITVMAVLLVMVIVLVYKYCHRPSKPFNFWTVELRDDHENVNFSSLMEQPELYNVDGTLLIDDARFSDTEDKRNIVRNTTYQPVRT